MDITGASAGAPGSASAGGTGTHTISPRTPRPPTIGRSTLRGLEGSKLSVALRQAAAAAEARHQCFEQVRELGTFDGWIRQSAREVPVVDSDGKGMHGLQKFGVLIPTLGVCCAAVPR